MCVTGSKDQNYKYIRSKNGKYLLLFEGFAYRKYMTSKSNQSYWTCTLRGCKAKATMSADGWFSLTKYLHNHEPSQEEMDKRVAMAELRQLALETDLSTNALLEHVNVSEESEKKYRDAINFWRWRAKRKSDAETAGYYENSKKLEFDNDYKFVKTEHSHFLQHKSYLYRKYMTSKTDSGSYWRCRREDCPARAKIDSSSLLTCTNFNHNHPEEEIEGEDMDQDIRQQIRQTALNTDFSIPDILKMYEVEDDAELKKYVKNIRCRKTRSMRQQMRRLDEAQYETVVNQLGVLGNVPPGVLVKIPKDLLCEISEVESGIDYPEGTILKVDDEAVVQVVNLQGDTDPDELEGAMLFKDDSSQEAGNDEEDDEEEDTQEDQGPDEEQGEQENLEEVQYETVTLSDYTTFIISDRDLDKDNLISHIMSD